MGGSLTWLGDGDPEAQSITQNGVHFVKGVPTTVKDKDVFERLSKNPLFDADAEVAKVEEPDEAERERRAEEGTEKGAIKAQLREMGETVKGNPSLETLRSTLASALAKQA